MRKKLLLLSLSLMAIVATSCVHAEKMDVYDITVPQELTKAKHNGFFQVSGSMSSQGLLASKTLASVYSGQFLCLVPRKNGVPLASKMTASFPGRNGLLYENVSYANIYPWEETYPWVRGMGGIIGAQGVVGRIFAFSSPAGYGAPLTCSFPGNSIPSDEVTSVQYNIRFQFRERTVLTFDRKVGGKKSWILGPQGYPEQVSVLRGGLPDSSTYGKWQASTVIAVKLDGTKVDLLKSYSDGLKTSEAFEIPGDTEILALTYVRKP